MGDDLPLLGGIEAGGTKCVLAVGTGPNAIHARHSLPTRSPAETLTEIASWFADYGQLAALGIASFGPVGLDPGAANLGHILDTPKPEWSQCDLAGFFAANVKVPIGFDTDVNAAALAEATAVELPKSGVLAYVTVGTGIGGGLVVQGSPIHGAAHPELGHIFPRRSPRDQDFAGICPYHGDCLEGLASGPAIFARWGAPLSDLPPDHEAHDIVADYLAQLCHSLFAMSAAQTIVLGGGVMKTPQLLARVKAQATALDKGYLPGHSHHVIRAPHLGDDAGISGALLLAQQAVALG